MTMHLDLGGGNWISWYIHCALVDHHLNFSFSGRRLQYSRGALCGRVCGKGEFLFICLPPFRCCLVRPI